MNEQVDLNNFMHFFYIYLAIGVFNTLAWERQEVIELPLVDGLPALAQHSAFGRTGYALGKLIEKKPWMLMMMTE